MSIREQFIERHSRSAELHRRGVRAMPSGINHDGRYLEALQLYVDRAQGPYKWDVDGNRHIDYVMGHGALLLGHEHPEVTRAVVAQAQRGTHYGACHELELEWAERVIQLVPSAEEVRFTASGTEATMLAMRLARAFTGRTKILKFQGHFHGWHDYALIGDRPPFDVLPQGVPGSIAGDVVLVPPDLEEARRAMAHETDVAAIIVEPSGGSWATCVLPEGFLPGLRSLADERGALLIFDEVITGFRWAPGGVQEASGVIPDLTTMAKILAGGLPGGALAGRRDLMELISFHEHRHKIIHQGTFNANPLSAAAGVSCLEIVKDPAVQKKAAAAAAFLRRGFNEILVRLGAPGCAYGESSVFHLMLGMECADAVQGDVRQPDLPFMVLKAGPAPRLAQNLEMGMLNHGVHLFHAGGFISAILEQEQLDATLEAFESCIRDMKAEGLL